MVLKRFSVLKNVKTNYVIYLDKYIIYKMRNFATKF